MTLGPDGNLWFTNFGNDTIGLATPSGTVLDIAASSIDEPTAITAGPDGNLWFTSPGGHTCTASPPTQSCVVAGLDPGTTYTVTVTATSDLGTGPASSPSNAVTP